MNQLPVSTGKYDNASDVRKGASLYAEERKAQERERLARHAALWPTKPVSYLEPPELPAIVQILCWIITTLIFLAATLAFV